MCRAVSCVCVDMCWCVLLFRMCACLMLDYIVVRIVMRRHALVLADVYYDALLCMCVVYCLFVFAGILLLVCFIMCCVAFLLCI